MSHSNDGGFGSVVRETHRDIDCAGAGGDVNDAALAAGSHTGEGEKGGH